MRERSQRPLSPEGERLVVLMQAINFGEIHDLHVEGGQPVFQPRPEIVRFLRLGAENAPRPEIGQTDFAVKQPVLDLLEELRRLGDGCVRRIGIKHGLPTDLTVLGGLGGEVEP